MKTDIYFLSNLAHFLFELKILQTKLYRKSKHLIFYSQNVFFKNRAVFEIMWKNVVERGRPQMTTWRVRIACWVTKATNAHSEYEILIDFPLQQWSHERGSLLLYTYSTLHVLLYILTAMQVTHLWEKEFRHTEIRSVHHSSAESHEVKWLRLDVMYVTAMVMDISCVTTRNLPSNSVRAANVTGYFNGCHPIVSLLVSRLAVSLCFLSPTPRQNTP